MLEPDFGTGFILILTIIALILVSGIKKRYIIMAFFSGILGFIGLIISEPYRLKRIFAYLFRNSILTREEIYAIICRL